MTQPSQPPLPSRSRHLLLGLTGGIGAYKAADLARLLVQDGIDVQAVMTESACHFVGPTTLQALTGKPVLTSLWDTQSGNGMPHINLSRAANAILIAPASAGFIAKLAHGVADDLLSTLCLARACQLYVAPAMNRQMWENPSTQRNIALLRGDGIIILGPASGDQACGETGMGRMLEADELAAAIRTAFQPGLLQGKRVLITAGPTYEAIDTVRGITNASSGKTGYAVAQAALEAGAEVTLISGPVSLAAPSIVRLVHVLSAQEMQTAVHQEVAQTDIFISVAAVADYRAAHPSTEKIKKTDDNRPLTLELVPNPDILMSVTSLQEPPFCVGFAAESTDLEHNADIKRHKKKLPLLVANLAQDSIGSNESALVLLDDNGKHRLPKAPKIVQARLLIQHIATLYDKQKKVTLRS